MTAIISGPGEGERHVRSNRAVTIRVDLPQISIHEIEFDETFAVEPHTHQHADTMYVLQGMVEFRHDEHVTRAGPGTLITAPPGVRHGFGNLGPGRARVLVIHAPDGGFASLVRQTRAEDPRATSSANPVAYPAPIDAHHE
jgi:quercetin dioxygenase-like cupin family protein